MDVGYEFAPSWRVEAACMRSKVAEERDAAFVVSILVATVNGTGD